MTQPDKHQNARIVFGIGLAVWLIISLIVALWVTSIHWFLALSGTLWILATVAYIIWDLMREVDNETDVRQRELYGSGGTGETYGKSRWTR